jgi:hypothetical protein
MSVTVHIPEDTPGQRFFLGEDKEWIITIAGSGSIAGRSYAFVLKERPGDGYPELLRKDNIAAGNLVITDPDARILTITFDQIDTNGTGPFRPRAGKPYPFSVKQLGVGIDQIVTDGTVTFDEATQKEP